MNIKSGPHNKQRLPAGLKQIRSLSFPRKLGILERLYGSALKKLGVAWVECSNSVCWKLDLTDPTQRWMVYGDYQGSAPMSWAKQRLSHGGVVVDSGANIGQMLIYFAPLPGVKIYAFEPLPDAYVWLNECLQYYKQWNVDVFNAGLGGMRKKEFMQLDGPRSTTNMEWYKCRDLPRASIRIEKLDTCMDECSVDRIDLWKLDVEGAEYEALKGAEELFKNGAVQAMLLECNPNNFKRVKEFLFQYDCRICTFERGGLEEVRGDASDKKDFVVLRE